MRVVVILVCMLGASLWAGPLDRAWLKGATDRSPLLYRAGEEMTFTVTPMDVDWKAVRDGDYSVVWKRSGDDGLVETGRFAFAQSPFVYRTKLSTAGFVRLEATVVDKEGKPVRKPWLGDRSTPEGRQAANMFELYQNKVFFDGGAGVGVDTLRAKDEPDDFDVFWKKQFGRLDLVPIKADLIEVRRTDAKARLYAVRIDCAGLRPVTGYLEVPRDVDAGKTYPCVLETHGYSADRFTHDAPAKVRSDRIYLNINAHGQKLKEFGATEADRKMLKAEVQTRGCPYGFDALFNRDPETAYFNGMVLRVKRALQYLKTVKGWNGRDLLAIGGSQGGLQTIWAAGCGEGVTRAEAAVPWCCDMWRNAQRKGWYVPWTEAMGYYDPVNFAKRIPSVTCRTEIPRAGLGDYVCPPTGVAKLWNAIPGTDKRIVWVQGSEHGYVPPEYEGRDFVREGEK